MQGSYDEECGVSPSKYQNSKKYFLTAPRDERVLTLMQEYLPALPAETILFAGGVWLDRVRIESGAAMIRRGETLRIYHCPNQGTEHVFDEADVVFENQDVLVVFKPAGIPSTWDRSTKQFNLTHGVREWLRKQGSTYEPTAINRLDFMVSGLVIFPKNKTAEKGLFRMTEQRQIGKVYRAHLAKSESAPNCLRVRDRISFLNKAKIDSEGKHAHTLFIKTGGTDVSDIYSVFIFTGRRHQIRLHAATYLEPILGDGLYGSRFKDPNEVIALQCVGYNLVWKGEKIRVRLPERYLWGASIVNSRLG